MKLFAITAFLAALAIAAPSAADTDAGLTAREIDEVTYADAELAARDANELEARATPKYARCFRATSEFKHGYCDTPDRGKVKCSKTRRCSKGKASCHYFSTGEAACK